MTQEERRKRNENQRKHKYERALAKKIHEELHGSEEHTSKLWTMRDIHLHLADPKRAGFVNCPAEIGRFGYASIREVLKLLHDAGKIIVVDDAYALRESALETDLKPPRLYPCRTSELLEGTLNVPIGESIVFVRNLQEKPELESLDFSADVGHYSYPQPRYVNTSGRNFNTLPLDKGEVYILAAAGSTFYGLYPKQTTLLESLPRWVYALFEDEFKQGVPHDYHLTDVNVTPSAERIISRGDGDLKEVLTTFTPSVPSSPKTHEDVASKYMKIREEVNDVLQRQEALSPDFEKLRHIQEEFASSLDASGYSLHKNRHAYKRSPVWGELRRLMWIVYEGRCGNMGCGRPAQQLHHFDYENYGRERLSDVVPLCGDCHMFEHGISHAKALVAHTGDTAQLQLQDRRTIPNLLDIFHNTEEEAERRVIRLQKQHTSAQRRRAIEAEKQADIDTKKHAIQVDLAKRLPIEADRRTEADFMRNEGMISRDYEGREPPLPPDKWDHVNQWHPHELTPAPETILTLEQEANFGKLAPTPPLKTLEQRLVECLIFCEQRNISTDPAALAWQLGVSEDDVRAVLATLDATT